MSLDNYDGSSKELLTKLSFSRETKDWRIWSECFKAYANNHGYLGILEGTTDVPKHYEKLDTMKDTEKILARKLNNRAYSDLLLSCANNSSFGIIQTSKTADLPAGDAKLAWDNLVTNFQPSDQTTRMELLTEFYKLKLEDVEGPEKYFSEMAYLKQRFQTVKYNLEDDDIICKTVTELPEQYKSYKPVLIQRMKDTMNPLTLKELQALLRTEYRIGEHKESKDSGDTAMVAGKFKKQFKGTCNKCGKWGHKGADCKTSEKKGYKGRCNYCKIVGHKETECRKKKREENNKSNDGQADLAFIAQNKSDDVKDLWIADTGASSHMTNSMEGMSDLKETDETITVGNGATMTVKYVGTYTGKVQTTKGQELTLKLNNVKVVPELYCNLFSVITALKQGGSI